MDPNSMVFWVAAGVAGSAALNLVFQSKPINAVLSLVVVLFALAVIYLQLSAQFVAILQIIIYAGAIMVLFLFVVMLLNLQKNPFAGGNKPTLRSFGVLLGGTLIIEISLIARALMPGSIEHTAPATPQGFGSVEEIGCLLFSKFLLPFELTSMLLLTAVAGALVLARRKELSSTREENQ